MSTILIIDDDADFIENACNVLSADGHELICADCPDSAFPLIREQEIGLILCDLHMPFTNGEQRNDFLVSYEVGIMTIQELRTALPDVPMVALSAASPSDLNKIQKSIDPIAAFSKPSRGEELRTIVSQALENHCFDA